MIKRLKNKFVALSMLCLTVLLAAIVIGMNAVNYAALAKEADSTLELLSKNKGFFPDMKGRMPPHMSKETPYETRYFSVLFNEKGKVIQTDTARIASVDRRAAISYASQVHGKKETHGFLGYFRYMRYAEGKDERITFLDCSRRLHSSWIFFVASVGMSLLGLAAVFWVILFFAGKILRPVAESYDKQKRFITDAGHEIKTPLTIINANVDLLEMDFGENECLSDIRKQAYRLTLLTNDLVYLAKMEEPKDMAHWIKMPFSDIVSEAAVPFEAVAQSQNKRLSCSIQPMLSGKGNPKEIQRLISILLDNAFKYSPPKEEVSLTFFQQGKSLCLQVSNKTLTPVSGDALAHIFDRFYRTDESRNSQTGGYGIGLSVAKAIVLSHGGKIRATAEDGNAFQIHIWFPG